MKKKPGLKRRDDLFKYQRQSQVSNAGIPAPDCKSSGGTANWVFLSWALGVEVRPAKPWGLELEGS